MAIRLNNEERSFGADRERQREISMRAAQRAVPVAKARSQRCASMPVAQHAAAIEASPRWIARSSARSRAKAGAQRTDTAHEFDSSEARAADGEVSR